MDVFLFFCIILISGSVKGGSNGTNGNIDSATLDEAEYVVVETANGKLRGKVFPAVGKEGKVAHFLGIPYAEKPIGKLRFTDPLPKEKWEGTRDSFNYGNRCTEFADHSYYDEYPASHLFKSSNPKNEDCLYMNVWVPYPLPKNATVMVWFHGGGFIVGSASMEFYSGEILAGYTDVIVVSFNYRIVSLGFLSSGDDRIKGNFGLKDQLLALKWINNNIARFGGNPSSVTLFGHDAGAASIRYHLISPLSDNLFHRAIMHSGFFHSQYCFSSSDWTKFHFKKFIATVNCPDDDNVLSCLQQVPVSELNKYVTQSFKINEIYKPISLPVIDGEFIKEDPHYSIDKYDFKKVPTLLILTKDEGSTFLLFQFPKYFHLTNESCLSRNQFHQATDDIGKNLSPNIRELVKYIYTDWTDSTSPAKNRDAVVNIFGDKVIECPVHHFAEIAKAYNLDVYLAEFNYRASNEKAPEWLGIYHSSELQFVFGHPFNKSKGNSDKDRLVSQRLMTYWSNFAKFGNPNGDPANKPSSDADIQWPSLHSEHQHLEISDELKIGQHLKDDKCQFWNVLVPALNHLSCSAN